MGIRTCVAALCLAFVFTSAGDASRLSAASADVRVTPGELVVDHPTLINLGFEWLIDGDANRNASVEVSYRKQGETPWKRGLPLLRLQGERIFQPNSWDLVSPNMFAGSILDLEPGTAYEAKFVLSDPDGLAGRASNATKTVVVRTRPEPMPFAGGQTYHVYPATHAGQKLEPAFEGIMCAYYYTCGGGDTTTTARPRVKAGDTILVHAGHYAYHPEFYGPDRSVNVTSPYEGTYYLAASGTAERPIAIKAAGDGEVVLDGRGNFALFNVMAADYNYFEGLTFRNTDIAIWAGRQFIAGAKGAVDQALPVRRRRHGRVQQLLGLQRLLHRRQHLHRPRRSESPDRLERRLLAADRGRRRAGVSADDGVVRGGEALRSRPRRGLQLRRQLPRWHRHRDLRQSRRLARHRRSTLSAARRLGSVVRSRSTSTTTT